jgi:hypothetical protein
MDMNYRIKINLVYAKAYTRWPCHVCGGCADRVTVLAEGRDDGGDTIRVCETCLKAGDINARLERHAKNLEDYAIAIRSLVGRLQVPTYQEWQDKVEELHFYQVMRDWAEQGDVDGEYFDVQHGDEFNEVEYVANPHTFA